MKYYYIFFMKEKTKTQLGKIICPRLDIQEGLEPAR